MINIDNQLSHRKCEPEKSTLYIVGTPIGNLTDISKRAVKILKNVNLIACEDTRVTLKLLNYLNLSNKLISLNDNNYMSRFNTILNQLHKGSSVALVSDAGMPLISDPGESLVKFVRSNNFDVISVPGPCAAISALISSGLSTSQFVFYGFIPKTGKERANLISSIHNSNFTSIIYESPNRVKKLLSDLNNICGGERDIAILRELTKKYEQHIGNKISEVIKYFEKNEPRGEFTIIISSYKKTKIDEISEIKSLKEDLIYLTNAGLSHSKAANFLSKKHNISRNKIYNLALK